MRQHGFKGLFPRGAFISSHMSQATDSKRRLMDACTNMNPWMNMRFNHNDTTIEQNKKKKKRLISCLPRWTLRYGNNLVKAMNDTTDGFFWSSENQSWFVLKSWFIHIFPLTANGHQSMQMVLVLFSLFSFKCPSLWFLLPPPFTFICRAHTFEGQAHIKSQQSPLSTDSPILHCEQLWNYFLLTEWPLRKLFKCNSCTLQISWQNQIYKELQMHVPCVTDSDNGI